MRQRGPPQRRHQVLIHAAAGPAEDRHQLLELFGGHVRLQREASHAFAVETERQSHFPIGVLQLYRSVAVGYFEARQLDFLTTRPLRVLEWLRLPGDAVFIVGGVLPLILLCWRAVRSVARRPAAGAESLTPLFTLFWNVVKEYWVVRPEDRVVQVYRNPSATGSSEMQSVAAPAVLHSSALPSVQADLAALSLGGSST